MLPTDLPEDIQSALATDAVAGARFTSLPPSHRREYLDWIGEAKKDDTRRRRIAGMIDRLTRPGFPR
ncbi:MAG: YdeI/OmpD-associated family protein [Bauldia sp.]|nr:YdeI/OmpD-associated family protein [Bauldia sp.]